MSKRRVVVTGLGIVSPLGNDLASSWDGIVNGRSGIGPITHFDASAFPTRISGEVRGFVVAEVMGRPNRRAAHRRPGRAGAASARSRPSGRA